MKRFIIPWLALTALLIAETLRAATSAPADEVMTAINNLADAANYSWTVTYLDPIGSSIPDVVAWPMEYKIEKGGFLTIFNRSDYAMGTVHQKTNTSTIIRKGDNVVCLLPDGTWATPAEMLNLEQAEWSRAVAAKAGLFQTEEESTPALSPTLQPLSVEVQPLVIMGMAIHDRHDNIANNAPAQAAG